MPVEIRTREPVDLEETAAFGDGVTAELTSIKAVKGSAQGVGEISGPALELRIRLANGTEDRISMDYVVVNVTYGKTDTPANVLTGDPAFRPFAGTLKPGAKATGVYVFALPLKERDDVAINVSYRSLSPIVVLEGEAPR